MLLRISLSVGGIALLCALVSHLRRHKRVGGGIVLAAAMLTLQAIVHPPSQQVIAQQTEEKDELGSESGEPLSMNEQMRRQTKGIRLGRGIDRLTLCMHAHESIVTPPERRTR